MNKRKIFLRILNNPRNVGYNDFVLVVTAFGFSQARVSGSHCIFKNDAIGEIINIQNVNGEAKPYQIKQFLTLVEKYSLRMED